MGRCVHLCVRLSEWVGVDICVSGCLSGRCVHMCVRLSEWVDVCICVSG